MIDGGVVLRLRSGTECVDLGLALLRAEWRPLVRATGGWFVGLTTLSMLAWWIYPWFGLLVSLFFGYLLQVPVVRIAAARASGQPPAVRWQDTLQGMMQLFWVGLLPFFLLLLSIFLGPLVLWVGSRIVFLPEVLLVEKVRDGAFRRMEQLLSRGGAMPFIACFWWFSILTYGVLAGEATGQALVADLFQLGHPFGKMLDGTLTPYPLLGILLVSPIWALIRFALYLDLRTRAESLDVFFALWAAAGKDP